MTKGGLTPKTNKAPVARRVLCGLILTIGLLAAAHLVMQYLNFSVYHEKHGQIFELSNRVDFDDEVSVPTWFSEVLFLCIAGTAFLLSYLQSKKAPRLLWAIIATIAVLMSLDEGASIHEMVLQIIHLKVIGEVPPVLTDNAWLLVLPFIGAAALLLLWFMVKHLPRQTIVLCVIGGVIYLSGAVFIDMISTTSATNTFYNSGVLVAIEEVSELLGATIILYAFIRYTEQFYGSRIKAALKQLRS